MTTEPPVDPVLARREVVRAWCSRGQRLGYALLVVFMVAAFAGMATGFPTWIAVIAWGALGVATLALVPAIVFGYAVKAADRADREGDW